MPRKKMSRGDNFCKAREDKKDGCKFKKHGQTGLYKYRTMQWYFRGNMFLATKELNASFLLEKE
jgi:hypothetical protein